MIHKRPRPRTPAPSRIPAATTTVSGAAQLLGISRTLAYALVRTGQLPAIRLGRRLVVPLATLQRLLNQQNGDEPK
jgi:excisionase family DNA binding protein